MQDWKTKALELLPEMEAEVSESDTPMMLWIEIWFRFEEAYEEPRNDDFIRRVYEFEEWCLDQESDTDAAHHLPTCVVVTFWEHIPTNEFARKDMPRWFSIDEVLANRNLFSYFLSPENFEDLVNMYSNTLLRLEPGREFHLNTT